MMRDWDFWGGWHMPFFSIGPLFFILLLVLVFWLLMRGRTSDSDIRTPPNLRETPREILDRRYAAGEITREQYEQMKRDLA